MAGADGRACFRSCVEQQQQQSAQTGRCEESHRACVESSPGYERFRIPLRGKGQISGLIYVRRHAELGVEANARQYERQHAQQLRSTELVGEDGEYDAGSRCVQVEGFEDRGDDAAGEFSRKDLEGGGGHHPGEERKAPHPTGEAQPDRAAQGGLRDFAARPCAARLLHPDSLRDRRRAVKGSGRT